MDSVNKTLYIPLYGKAYTSKKGLFLTDKKAEEIWESEKFPLNGRSTSKWLAYYMSIRAAVFDSWLQQQMNVMEDAVILHVGCGMDSRILRVGTKHHQWYDVDFPRVISERKRYYTETANYHMIAADVRDCNWLTSIPQKRCAIVIMEGVSMYLTSEELQTSAACLCAHFSEVFLLMDCYTVLAAKLSKYKNPIHDVGVTEVYGLDNPTFLEESGLAFVKEHTMIPEQFIEELPGVEKYVFRKLYARRFSKKLYRLLEYRKQ